MNVEWRKISDWRNWRLPVKLGVVLLVPVAVAVGAGALQISGYVDKSDSYVQMQGLVRLRADLAPLISSVQQERTLAAQSATSGSGVGAYQNQIRATDNAASTVRRRVERTEGVSDVAKQRFLELGGQLETLKNLREKVSQGGDGGDPSGGTTGYTAIVKSLLDFEQALVSQFNDNAISGTAQALHNMVIAQEQISLQHALVLAGIGRGKLLGPEVRALEQSDIRLQDRLSDFQAIGTTEQRRAYDQTVTGAPVALRNAFVERALTQPEGTPPPATRPGQPKPPQEFGIAVDDWNKSSGTTARLMEQVGRELQDELANTAASLQDDTSNKGKRRRGHPARDAADRRRRSASSSAVTCCVRCPSCGAPLSTWRTTTFPRSSPRSAPTASRTPRSNRCPCTAARSSASWRARSTPCTSRPSGPPSSSRRCGRA